VSTIGTETAIHDHVVGLAIVAQDQDAVQLDPRIRRHLDIAIYEMRIAEQKLHALRPVAPAIYRGWQPGNGSVPGFELWNLTAAVGAHPAGSTVSRATLEKAGYRIPPTKTTEARR
jgi:hypothetical protein